MNQAIERLFALTGEELAQEKQNILASPALRYLETQIPEQVGEFRAELGTVGSLRDLSAPGQTFLRLGVVSRFVETMFTNADDEPVSDEQIYQTTLRQIKREEAIDADVLAGAS